MLNAKKNISSTEGVSLHSFLKNNENQITFKEGNISKVDENYTDKKKLHEKSINITTAKRRIISYIINRTSPYTCITDDNKTVLESDISKAVEEINFDDFKKYKNPEHAMDSFINEANEKAAKILQWVANLRLDCKHCLNNNCEYRSNKKEEMEEFTQAIVSSLVNLEGKGTLKNI